MTDPARTPPAYGQQRRLTPVDRFGVWLSARRLRREANGFKDKRVGDFGCGYHATFVRSILPDVASATVIDVAIAPDLVDDPKVTAIEGALPDALAKVPDASLDVVMCISVLEHLWDPEDAVRHLHRTLAPGGRCLVNVPSWRGKRMLELSAFRIGLSEPASVDDHKRYYDPRDLWPLLVAGGFRPHGIRCFRHKFGLNTFAVCKVDDS